MKILFFGDSITDAGRNREADLHISSLGYGFVRVIADRLQGVEPEKYEIINRGIGGNRVVDLYSRIKCDAWNLQPDVLSILIGINDIWHGLGDDPNDVELERFVKVYRMLIEDTLKVLPNVKIMLCEPFVLHGNATDPHFEKFSEIKEYAKEIKKMADEYGLAYVPLQAKLDEMAAKFSPQAFAGDGVHPTVAGAKVIADEWLKVFRKEIDK